MTKPRLALRGRADLHPCRGCLFLERGPDFGPRGCSERHGTVALAFAGVLTSGRFTPALAFAGILAVAGMAFGCGAIAHPSARIAAAGAFAFARVQAAAHVRLLQQGGGRDRAPSSAGAAAAATCGQASHDDPAKGRSDEPVEVTA